MDLQAWLAVMISLGAVLFLAVSSWAPHMILLTAAGLAVVLGLVSPEQGLAGFANSGVATIATLFVVVAGVRHGGVLDVVGPWLLGQRSSAARARLRSVLPVAASSAFVNNTPVVALMIPAVTDWCRRHGIAPSRVLMAISYAAILGGTCTLIGTSTNLVVDGLLAAEGGERLSLFTPMVVGLPITIAGLAVLVVGGRWLLPDREPALSSRDDARHFTVELLVPEGSSVAGQTIAEGGLRHLSDVYLVRIIRDGEALPVARPSDVVHVGDRLVFAGSRHGVAEVASRKGLDLAHDEDFRSDHGAARRVLVEAVIAHTSPLLGRTVNQAAFRTHYNAAVVAVARHGQRIGGGIGDHQLQAGDIVLLETVPSFYERFAYSSDFYLVGEPDHEQVRDHRRAPLAAAILIAMVVLAGTGILPMLSAALIAAAAMVVTGCCSMVQARQAVDVRLLVAIAAAFGLGASLQHTGAAESMATQVVALAGGHPWWTLVAIYVTTVVITELVTNNAAAVIVFPIAIAAAAALQVSMLPFAVAVMVAASASFITPVGYQANLMVMAPGGYRYGDYLRSGIPVAVVVAAVALIIIPQAFPFISP